MVVNMILSQLRWIFSLSKRMITQKKALTTTRKYTSHN